MKIYVGKNVTGYLKASLSLDTMMRYSCDGKIISGNIPLIHNAKVYMIQVYYGYDKNKKTGESEDVTKLIGPFYSVASAESSESWKSLETIADYSGIPYVKAKGFLAQKNNDGSLFRHGDISNDLFNAKIPPALTAAPATAAIMTGIKSMFPLFYAKKVLQGDNWCRKYD